MLFSRRCYSVCEAHVCGQIIVVHRNSKTFRVNWIYLKFDNSAMKVLRLLLSFVVFHQYYCEAKRASKLDYKSKQSQADLLRVFGIEKKPKFSRGRSRVPKYVMDLYRQKAYLDGYTKDGFSTPGTTVRTFFRGELL